MKKLMLGMAALLFAANFVQAKAVIPQEKEAVQFDTPVPAGRETLAGVVLIAQEGKENEDGARSKSYSKTYAVDGNDKLNLSNRYGDVVFKSWDKNEVKADIEIKAYGRNDGEAQSLLDETVIESGKTSEGVFFKTVFSSNDNNYSSGSKNGKVRRREVRITYVVYLPVSIALTINNQYGNINMGSFSGPLYAKIQYGDFTAVKLGSTNNYLSVQYGKTNIQEANKVIIKQQYGSGLTLGVMGTVDLDVQYAGVTINTIKGEANIKLQYGGGLNIGSVDNLDLNAQYSNVNITNISGNATIKQQYNNISLGAVNKLSLDGQYVNVKIANLKGDGNFKISYNKLNIDRVGNGCKNLIVSATYAGVALGFGSGYRADFDVKTTYGNFKAGNDVSSKGTDNESSTKNYTGKIGEGGSARVTVKSTYGNVNFN